jgi:hypothetical protein
MSGPSARNDGTQTIHYLRKSIAYTDGVAAVVTVGLVPINAVVLRGGVVITTAFNAGSTNVLDIGTLADDDGFATDLAMGTIGVIVADEMATSNDMGPMTADTAITATLALTGTAPTTGAGIVWVEYMANL